MPSRHQLGLSARRTVTFIVPIVYGWVSSLLDSVPTRAWLFLTMTENTSSTTMAPSYLDG